MPRNCSRQQGEETLGDHQMYEDLVAGGLILPPPAQQLSSTPSRLGTTPACIQLSSVALPRPRPGLVTTSGWAANCDANGDIVCDLIQDCAFIYKDPAGCNGDCISQSTDKTFRKTGFFFFGPPAKYFGEAAIKRTVCAGAVTSGLAAVRCFTDYGLVDCSANWPAPTPTTLCR